MSIFGGSLGGSYSSSHGRGTSSTQTSGSSSTDLSGTSRTKRFDDESKALLDALSGRAFGELDEESGFTREQAIADSQDTIQAIFRQFSEQALPQIYQAQGQAGAYNSTSGQFLANDAFGESVARSAEVVSQNIARYAQLGQQERQLQVSTLLDALKLQGTAFEESALDQTSSSDYTGKSNTSNRQSASGWDIGASISSGFGL